MKRLKLILTAFLLAITISSCSLSTNDLAAEVQKNMAEKFTPQGITIKNFVLTKKGGNVYSGILETKEANGDFTYTVEVIYDGSNMQWEVKT